MKHIKKQDTTHCYIETGGGGRSLGWGLGQEN